MNSGFPWNQLCRGLLAKRTGHTSRLAHQIGELIIKSDETCSITGLISIVATIHFQYSSV